MKIKTIKQTKNKKSVRQRYPSKTKFLKIVWNITHGVYFDVTKILLCMAYSLECGLHT